MKNRKIFIAINLDEGAKKYISDKLSALKEKLNANWTKPDQYHITLSFLGLVEDEAISRLCSALRIALGQTESFDLFFNSLEIVPSVERPKLLWLGGESSKEFLNTRQLIQEALAGIVGKKMQFESRPHVTLARLKRRQGLPNEEMAILANKIPIKASIPVSSVDVMESVNEKGIWKHYYLEQIEL